MILESYQNVLFKRFLKERFFDNGISPSNVQIKSLLNQARRIVEEIDGSLINFNPSGRGSASRISKVIDTFITEIKAIHASSNTSIAYANQVFDRALNNATLINKLATETTLNVCTFELARQVGMHLNSFDAFVNFSKINQNKTTAEINVGARTATLPKQPVEKLHNLIDLLPEAFSVIVLKGPYIGLSLANGSAFENIVDNSESYWAHELLSKSDGTRSLALQIDTGSEINISTLSMSLLEADSDDILSLRALTSLDGLKWQEVAPKRSYNAPEVQIRATPTLARYIRLEFERVQPSYQITDNEIINVYRFGLDNFQVFETNYYPEAQVVSKPIVLKDKFESASNQNFDRVRVDVSDQRPKGTEIIYYLSTSNDPDLLTRVETGKEIKLNTTAQSNSDQIKVRSRFDNYHAILDLTMEDNFIPESVEFFKNTFQRNVFLDGVQSGWEYENSYYSCTFEIESEFVIDLGINSAFINGKRQNGINVLQPGFYNFRTHEVNWIQAPSEDVDPLFPHNHKLLIEGIPSSTTYPGVDFMAAKKLRMVSAFDLVENISSSDNRFFAIRNKSPLIKITRPPVLSDTIEGWRSEQHALRYKYLTSSIDQVTSVTLIAKLSTSDIKLTPVFKGFTIIAGS